MNKIEQNSILNLHSSSKASKVIHRLISFCVSMKLESGGKLIKLINQGNN